MLLLWLCIVSGGSECKSSSSGQVLLLLLLLVVMMLHLHVRLLGMMRRRMLRVLGRNHKLRRSRRKQTDSSSCCGMSRGDEALVMKHRCVMLHQLLLLLLQLLLLLLQLVVQLHYLLLVLQHLVVGSCMLLLRLGLVKLEPRPHRSSLLRVLFNWMLKFLLDGLIMVK